MRLRSGESSFFPVGYHVDVVAGRGWAIVQDAQDDSVEESTKIVFIGDSIANHRSDGSRQLSRKDLGSTKELDLDGLEGGCLREHQGRSEEATGQRSRFRLRGQTGRSDTDRPRVDACSMLPDASRSELSQVSALFDFTK